MITNELDKRIGVAQAIIRQLEANQPLSSVLSQARLLANMMGDIVKVALMDILIHGLTNIPYQGKPFTDEAYKKAGIQHMRLCSIEDLSKLDINEIVNAPWRERIPVRDQVVTLSVYEMENYPPAPAISPSDSDDMANLKLQLDAFHDRVKSILTTLRACIYDYVSGIWLTSTREKDRIALLGPDYRFIIDRLDALHTPVGGDLLASVDALSSSNPDSWKLCALGCRNVVIKLGETLWNVPGPNYQTRSGKVRDVSMGKEKNRLLAYIDAHLKKTTAGKQAPLDEARGLVISIYNKGSKGKKRICHAEAQTLVVDTFHLVDLLNEATGVKRIDALP